jgi:DNA-binding beta-propeller fold protein YncE
VGIAEQTGTESASAAPEHPRTRKRGREIAGRDGRDLARAEEMRSVETRTQGGRIAALWGRRRTKSRAVCGAAICVAVAMALPAGASAANVRESLPPITEAAGAPLVSPTGLTVDSGDHLFVTEAFGGTVDKFGPAGNYEAQTPPPTPWGGPGVLYSAAFDDAADEVFIADSHEDDIWGLDPADAGSTGVDLLGHDNCCTIRVAADNSGTAADGDLYVYRSGAAVILRLDATGAPAPFSAGPAPGTNELTGAETETGTFETENFEGGALAVDAAGDLWFVDTQHGIVYEFAPSGELLKEIIGAGGKPFAKLAGIAIDPDSGNILLADNNRLSTEQTSVLELSPTGTLEGEFTGTGGEPFVEGSLRGIAVDSTGRLYVADVHNQRVDVFGPATVPPIESDGGSVLEATATSATLAAEVNPNTHAAAYYFQWGTSACDVVPTPCADLPAAPASLGSGKTTVRATQRLTGLALATTYHYRLLVEDTSTHELFAGPDRTFTTQGLAPFGLPDGRGYELVSPALKSAGRIEPISERGTIEAAASGGAITYFGNAPIVPGASGAAGSAIQALSSRGTSGWSTQIIAPPHQRATGAQIGIAPEYRFFTEDLSRAIIQPFGTFDPELSPDASEQTPYLRTLGSCTSDCYQPLVTAVGGHANALAGFGEEHLCEEENPLSSRAGTVCGPLFLGATKNLSHAVLVSAAPLTAGAPVGKISEAGATIGSLYEWTAAHLQLISLLPANKAGEELPAAPGATLGQRGPARQAISGDGRRIFWNTGGAAPAALYMRDTVLEKTIQLDAAETFCLEALECESGGGHLQIASSDGSRAFFTDTRRLTRDSGAAAGKADLYECRIGEVAGRPTCALTDLTPEIGGEHAEVQGEILGDGEDGEDLYFVANGRLGTGPNSAGESAVSGQPNLYVRRGGATIFIATLSPGDKADWRSPPGQPTRVSPDGHFLEFMSERSLTGYDSRDRVSDERDAEIFLYDVDAGRTTCVSCDPTGGRPAGIEFVHLEGEQNAPLASVHGQWAPTGWVAALPPGGSLALDNGLESAYQPRYLSNSGRLFFNALGGLVPADSNGVGDVYESEPAGIGGCNASDPGYQPSTDRCLDLISSGTSPESSSFLDASESGDDVFFLTHSKLSGKDVDNAADVYDASVGGGEAEPVKAVECSGEACQQATTPPAESTPGSPSFSGPGNVVQCRKGQVKKAGKCVKKQQAKKHKKQKKKYGKKSKQKAKSKKKNG